MNNRFKLIQKYNKEFSEMLNMASKLVECNKKNCKKKFDELENYKKKILREISVLTEKEKTTISYKDFQSNLQKITDDYRNKKVVILFFDNIKKDVENDKETIKNYTKEFKIYQKKVKKNLKMYLKKEKKKYYINETNKLLNKMIESKENINLLKCSYEKCLELHKKDLIMVKNFTEKLCKEKKKKSCKIYKMIDNLDLTKIIDKNNNKIIKLIKKRLF